MRWELGDIGYFVAVARAGTTLGAAQRLGVNQTTCARRIAALESALGLRLFDKGPAGYALTDAGRALLPAAEAVDAAGAAFGDGADAIARLGLGVIRITIADSLADSMLIPVAARYRERHPDIRLEIDVSTHMLDLQRGESDIAIRAGPEPCEPQLIRRPLPYTAWGVYAAPRYIDRYGAPRGVEDAPHHDFASLDGAALRVLRTLVDDGRIAHITNTVTALIPILQAGDCVGAMPCIVGDAAPGLVRCFLVEGGDMWLVYPERLRGLVHVRTLLDLIAENAEQLRPALAGQVAIA